MEERNGEGGKREKGRKEWCKMTAVEEKGKEEYKTNNSYANQRDRI